MKDKYIKKDKEYYNTFPPLYWRERKTYEPWYDDERDYNTNAKSYYDYLARFNRFISIAEHFINRLLDRNIEVKETASIEFLKVGDWLDNENCVPEHYDDITTLSANVKLSSETVTRKLKHLKTKVFNLKNELEIFSDGVFSPDVFPILEAIDEEIGLIYEELAKLDKRVTKLEGDLNDLSNHVDNIEQNFNEFKESASDNLVSLENSLQKIIDNLFNSGAITSNNIYNFNFKQGRNIATGNINLFGGTPDGNSFIRTGQNGENDITAGVK